MDPPGKTRLVELLAFAPNGGWYVMFQDGLAVWHDLPIGLQDLLKGRMSQPWLPKVDELSCGPRGEWVVRFMDGKIKDGGLCAQVKETMNVCRRKGRRIMSVHFFQDRREVGWVIRHDGARLVLS